MVAIATLEKLSSAANPKVALIAEVGDLSSVKLLSNRVLVAIYIGGKFHQGTTILRTTEAKKEDVYQGVVGLVIKKGPMAFVDDDASKTYFHGQDVSVGEWIVFRPGDAKRVQVRGVDCRSVEDITIDMVIEDPEIITHK